MFLHRAVGAFLQAAVKRCVDSEAVSIQVESVFFRLFAQLLSHVLDKVGSDSSRARPCARHNGILAEGFVLRFGKNAFIFHSHEHRVPPRDGAIVIPVRVVSGRIFQQSDKKGAFGNAELSR